MRHVNHVPCLSSYRSHGLVFRRTVTRQRQKVTNLAHMIPFVCYLEIVLGLGKQVTRDLLGVVRDVMLAILVRDSEKPIGYTCSQRDPFEKTCTV